MQSTTTLERKYKEMFKLLSRLPYQQQEKIDLMRLAESINKIQNKNHAQLILDIMRQDPNYTEHRFSQTEHGIQFDLQELTIPKIHLLYQLIQHISKM